jgi:hypothetical protein
VDVPVYQRAHLGAGTELPGPAIIEQADTTTVLYPGHRAVVDGIGNLIVHVGDPESRPGGATAAGGSALNHEVLGVVVPVV